MRKLIIYLDQNFLSDIAKFKSGINYKVKPDLLKIFELIKKGVDEEKFVVPDSASIKSETAATLQPDLVNAIRTHLKYLGQVSLKHEYEIRDEQFRQALLGFLGKESTKNEDWQIYFHEDPNKPIDNFSIDINFKHMDFSGNRVESMQRVRETGVKAHSQYKKEIVATRQYYKNRIRGDFKFFLYHHCISIEEAECFIDSKEFETIPNIDIFSMLWSKDLANRGRKGKNSDFVDISTISTYLPYCHVMTMDKYMATLVRELKLDEKYNCKVYTMKDDDLLEMGRSLDNELRLMSPVNQSVFSIMCYLAKGASHFTPQFVSMISSAINDFCRRLSKFNGKTLISVYFALDEKYSPEKELFRNIIKKNGKFYLKYSEKMRTDTVIFLSNFYTLKICAGEGIQHSVSRISEHRKGQMTAFIRSDFKIEDMEVTEDLDLIDDIFNAIKEGKSMSEKYKFCLVKNV